MVRILLSNHILLSSLLYLGYPEADESPRNFCVDVFKKLFIATQMQTLCYFSGTTTFSVVGGRLYGTVPSVEHRYPYYYIAKAYKAVVLQGSRLYDGLGRRQVF